MARENLRQVVFIHEHLELIRPPISKQWKNGKNEGAGLPSSMHRLRGI